MLATGVLISVLGAGGFIWALRNRQLRINDREMYQAMTDGEPEYDSAASSVRPSPMARWVYGLVFAAVAIVIGWMIYLTVSIATHPPLSGAGWSDSPRAR